jgi:hypothetical protein
MDVTAAAFSPFIERLLPHYSEASVVTRELIHDSASDLQWRWRVSDGTKLLMTMKALPGESLDEEPKTPSAISAARQPRPGYMRIESVIPRGVIGFTGSVHGSQDEEELQAGRFVTSLMPFAALALLLAAAWWIAKFIARRVFLVDLVNPRWLSRGVLGLNHVICYPCDDHLEPTLFADYRTIDLSKPEDRAGAETLPQDFENPFEEFVVVRGIDHRVAAGGQAALLRGLIERLTRNGDRKVVIRPTSMSVITNALLQGKESDQWARTLSSFVWVDGYQLLPDTAPPPPPPRISGPHQAVEELPPVTPRKPTLGRRVIRAFAGAFGFGTYVEQIVDNRHSAKRTIEEETKDDRYLLSLIHGLRSEATARDPGAR